MDLTWTMAATIVGSVGSICLTILKIISMKKNGDSSSESKELPQKNAQTNAVQQEQINELKDRMNRMQDSFEKLNDLLLDLLTKP